MLENSDIQILGSAIHLAIEDYASFRERPLNIMNGSQQAHYKRAKKDFESAREYLFKVEGLEEQLLSGGLNIDVDAIRKLAKERRGM